jgi:arylsulfatase
MWRRKWFPETNEEAAAGAPDVKDKLLKGTVLNGRSYKNHLDGYNQLDYLSGKLTASPRNEFVYVNDDGQIVALRWQDWKAVYLENRGQAFGVWREPFTELRGPLVFNLRRDPFERAQHNANTYNDWFLDRPYILFGINEVALRFLLTFKDYPPGQTAGSFNLENVKKQIEGSVGGK